jgi:hypothetical protein
MVRGMVIRKQAGLCLDGSLTLLIFGGTAFADVA